MEKKTKYIWYTIGIASLFIFFLILLSSLMNIGERLRQIHVSIEIIFYILVVIVIFFGIINPIRIIVCSPSLSITTSVDPLDKKAVKVYKQVSRNILKSETLKEEERLLLLNYENDAELLLNLQYVFEQNIKKDLNKIIIKNAKVVLISTALCQSARVDMLTTFTVNLQMIKQLVEKCGFRPNMKNLSKLTLNVLSTALIAEGLENMRLEDFLPQSTVNTLSEIPLIRPLVGSAVQGVTNALLTIRIGCVTRRYLFRDGNIITKEEIRKQSLKESVKILPMVLADTITFFPKKMVKFFQNNKIDTDEYLKTAYDINKS